MKKALVTGGMGFIGNHLVSRLLDMGMKVTILDKCIHKPVYKDISAAHIIDGDVLSRELLSHCLHEVDICYHLAAISSIDLCYRDWLFSHENNVRAFNGLLDAIRLQHKPVRLVYASSASVYGNYKQLPLHESLTPSPISTYGADKLSNEIYAQAMQVMADISSIGLRFFNVYGPGQLSSNPYTGVISSFKKAMFRNMPLTIFGDGQQTRDFVYIDDVVDALVLCMKVKHKSAEVLNICSGKGITIESLANMMIKLTNYSHGLQYKEERRGDLRCSVGDVTNAKIHLGFTAKTPIEAGLRYFLDSPFQA
ncbi:NAD-dependent epimerase/dehydratase family protein [Legionella spiritensis]|uniref:NAD-dependent epimerase/dehydratase family protein n=1 Tax=Legionella spiritensis TaxID=452 RepID=UPI000F702C5A|nr:NAD-dependent epimerase/dehydratase family protein [Legionella spiritensis]VEG90046.1 NAD dependent epimerase/dehydratase family protein [Legionella spiritensis]